MAYEPNSEWKDGASGGTPVTAAKLNRLEGGVADVGRVADAAAQAARDVVASIPFVASGDTSNLAAALATAPADRTVVLVLVPGS